MAPGNPPASGAHLADATWEQIGRALAAALGPDPDVELPDLERLEADGLAARAWSGVVQREDVIVGALVGVLRPDGLARIDTMAIAPDVRCRGFGAPIIAAWTRRARDRGAVDVRFETSDGPLDAMLTRLGFARRHAVHSLRAALRHDPVPGLAAGWPGHEAPLHRDDLTILRAPGVQVARHDATIVAWRGARVLGFAGDVSPRAVRRALRLLSPGDAQIVDLPEGPLLHALEAAGWVRYASRGEWGLSPRT